MTRLLMVLCALALVLPVLASAETWNGVTLVDTMCASKIKANPDEHKTQCAMSCGKTGGFGILTSSGDFLKFDAAGNKQAMAALAATKQADHLRATVMGELNGDTIKVASVKLD